MNVSRVSLLACSLLLTTSLAAGGGTSSSGSSSGSSSSGPATPATTIYSAAVTDVVVEVDYQTGAAPYTGSVPGFSDVWAIFRTNANRVFAKGAPKTVTIPSTLDAMEELTDVTGTVFTTDQILTIAGTHRQTTTGGSTASIYIVYLDGYLDGGDGGADDEVLGVSIGDSGVIALFKPVIAATSPRSTSNVDRFVEQSTLVHEFGHAVGLVNNGIPMTMAHQDTAHGAHCTNTPCSMYWENEGPAAAAAFAATYIKTADDILYGAECLADLDAAAAAAAAAAK
jgi:hypothetical protein